MTNQFKITVNNDVTLIEYLLNPVNQNLNLLFRSHSRLEYIWLHFRAMKCSDQTTISERFSSKCCLFRRINYRIDFPISNSVDARIGRWHTISVQRSPVTQMTVDAVVEIKCSICCLCFPVMSFRAIYRFGPWHRPTESHIFTERIVSFHPVGSPRCTPHA